MLIDVECSVNELQEVADYYKVKMPEIIRDDGIYTKIRGTLSFRRLLDMDNIAYWPSGDLINNKLKDSKMLKQYEKVTKEIRKIQIKLFRDLSLEEQNDVLVRAQEECTMLKKIQVLTETLDIMRTNDNNSI